MVLLACAEPVVDLAPDATVPSPSTATATATVTDTFPEDCPAAPWIPLEPHEPEGPLCEIPEDYVSAGGDPHDPPCAIAAGGTASGGDTYTLVDWNVRFGTDQDAILATLRAVAADLVVLQEVGRFDGDSDPRFIDQAHDLAADLGLAYAFAVEWDRRELEDGGEHGVAILSRYPMGNTSYLRLAQLNDWYGEDELYGGRVALAADVLVGCELVRVYSVHLDTRGDWDEGRALQGDDVRADADAEGRPSRQILAGDLNTWTCNPLVSADCGEPPEAEQVIEDLLGDGWNDAIPDYESYTQLGEGILPQRLDWVFYRGVTGGPGDVLLDAEGSDHYPIVWEFTP